MAGRRQEGIARSKGRSGTRGEQERGEQNGKIGGFGGLGVSGGRRMFTILYRDKYLLPKLQYFVQSSLFG